MEPLGAIERLEESWGLDGCLWALRDGNWNRAGAHELLELLRGVAVSGNEALPRRFVSLTWYLPIFLEWQLPRLSDPAEAAELTALVTAVRNELERLLGVP